MNSYYYTLPVIKLPYNFQEMLMEGYTVDFGEKIKIQKNLPPLLDMLLFS